MLSYDLASLLADSLARDRRPPDGLLHCSGDLCAPLRHVMLKAAGAPSAENDLASAVRLRIGTDLHTYFERSVLRGIPAMTEVKLDPWLPRGWSGTADWILWDAERRAFVLGDLKSVRPEGMQFILKGGAKNEHIHQLSAYWHALAHMGLPLVKGFGVLYVPTGQTGPRDSDVEPVLQWCEPLPFAYMSKLMAERRAAVEAYRASLTTPGEFLTDALAPVADRVQKLMPAKKDKPGQRDVLLVPDWYTRYCPFHTDLCPCSEQGSTKIGTWFFPTDAAPYYEPRAGYESITPGGLNARS